MKHFGALACLFVSCFLGPAFGSDNVTPISQTDLSRLFGLHLKLIDDRTVEELLFVKDGDVVATEGQKGEPLCGPIFTWSLSKEGVLTVASGKDIQFKWTAIGFRKTEVWVQSGGSVKRYSIVEDTSKN